MKLIDLKLSGWNMNINILIEMGLNFMEFLETNNRIFRRFY